MTIKKDKYLIVAETVLVFILSVVYFYALIIPQQSLYTNDGYYHYTISKLIAQNPFWVDIEWLPLTILGDNGPDHHWFWHLIVAPFTLFKDDFYGMKVAIVFFAASLPTTINMVARYLNIPFAPFFALLSLFGGVLNLARFSMLRAQNIAVIFIVLSIFALIRKKHILLGIIAFCFLQSYHGAIILFPIFIISSMVKFILLRENPLKGASFLLLGFCMGLVFNPWYPANIEYLFFHTLFKLQNNLGLSVGTEWQSPAFKTMLDISVPILSIYLPLTMLWMVQVIRKKIKLRPETAVLFLLSITFMIMFKFAIRFSEYFVPIAALTSGLILRDMSLFCLRTKLHKALAVLLLVCVCLYGENKARDYYRTNANRSPYAFKEIAQQLDCSGKKGDLVYINLWPIFPFFLWHTTKFDYVNGLDPNYLAYADINLFIKWIRVNSNLLSPEVDVADYIYKHFKAKWVIIVIRYDAADTDKKLLRKMVASPNARQIISTGYGTLFEIVKK